MHSNMQFASHLLQRQAAGGQGPAGSATSHKSRVDPTNVECSGLVQWQCKSRGDPTKVEWTRPMAGQQKPGHLSPSLVTALTVPASSVTPVPASRSLQRRQSRWQSTSVRSVCKTQKELQQDVVSHSVTADMSRAGDAGTGCTCAASEASDAPCHVEGRREGSPPPRRVCPAA